MNKKILGFGSILVAAFMLFGAGAAHANAATLNVDAANSASVTQDGSSTDPYSTIQAAVTAAAASDTISITGTQTVTSVINVTIPLTITGISGATIETTGTDYVFAITADGTTISNLAFSKTDTASNTSMVWINAGNVTIDHNTFTGMFNIGDGFVQRALTISGPSLGFNIGNNTFNHLRQPAYIDAATGTVHDNFTNNTKGWVVVSESNVTFTNNTWGTNVFDIAIIKNTPVGANNYPDIVAMSQANNNASIENQFNTPAELADVYVDGAAAVSGNGTSTSPYQTIAEAMTRVTTGGTIHVAAGTYAGGVTATKALTLKGANAGTSATGTRVAETIINTGAPAINVSTTAQVTIDGFTFDGTGSPVAGGLDTNIAIKNSVIKNTVGNATLYLANSATFVFTGNLTTNLSTDNDEGIFLAGNWNGVTGTVITITDNTWRDSHMTGMNLSNVSGTISGNTFDNIDYYGILLANNSSPMTVSNNTFNHINQVPGSPTYGAGIRFYTPSNTGAVMITGNTFSDSYIGVAVRDGSDISGQNITVEHNTFAGNTFGIFSNGTAGTLNAKNNWWNAASGPTVAGNPGGTGDAIGGVSASLISFDPHCANAACTAPTPTAATTVIRFEDLASSLATAGSKWFFYNDNTDTLDNNLGGFEVGPAGQSAGQGSAVLGATAGGAPILATLALANTRLDHITSLAYSTFKTLGDAPLMMSLQFAFDTDLTDGNHAYMGRLVYEPYFTHTVSDNTWQTWNPMDNAADGNWWFSNGTLSATCSQGNPCTWSEVLAAFPNSGITNLTAFKVGRWMTSPFSGNLDSFSIGIATGPNVHVATYDFEPAPTVTTTTTGGGGGGGGGGNLISNGGGTTNTETTIPTTPVNPVTPVTPTTPTVANDTTTATPETGNTGNNGTVTPIANGTGTVATVTPVETTPETPADTTGGIADGIPLGASAEGTGFHMPVWGWIASILALIGLVFGVRYFYQKRKTV